MTEIDLDRLGDVWRQQPDPAEMEKLRRTAAAVSRRARWGQVIDIVAAVAVGLAMLALAASRPGADTFLVSAALIGLLLWSQRQQRRLRAVELKSLTGTSEEMLDQSIAQTEATIRRTRFQLRFAPLGFLLGVALATLAGTQSTRELWNDLVIAVQTGSPIVLFGLLAVPVWAILSVLKIRNQKRQLERLTALRDAYRKESSAGEP